MRTMRLPKLKKLVEVMQIRGVKVFVHWSVLLIGAIILLGAVEDAPLAFTVLGAYYGVILLHECGHMVRQTRAGLEILALKRFISRTPPQACASGTCPFDGASGTAP